jgi:hypothetical protein
MNGLVSILVGGSVNRPYQSAGDETAVAIRPSYSRHAQITPERLQTAI